jgi:NitT/TauT family transport system substrate-binding protein
MRQFLMVDNQTYVDSLVTAITLMGAAPRLSSERRTIKLMKITTMLNRARVGVGCAVTLSIVGLGLAACSSDSGEGSGVELSELPTGVEPHPLDKTVKLTAAVGGTSEGYSALVLADRLGEFDKENLDVDVQVVTPGSTIFALMAQGKVDFAVTALFAGALNQIQAGSNIRVVAGGGGNSAPEAKAGWWQRSYGGETDIDACALKGKGVAIPTSGVSNPLALSLQRYLETCDLGFDDIRLQDLAIPDAVQALDSGAVEAAFVTAPFNASLETDGIAEFVEPEDTGIIATLMGDLKDRPEVAQAVLRALTRTVQDYLTADYREDPKVMAELVDYLGADETVIGQSPPRVFDPEIAPSTGILEPVQELWIDEGDILSYDEPLPDVKIVDTSILNTIRPE